MAQTAAELVTSPGDYIDYTPGADVTAGDVVVVGNNVYIAPNDIDNAALGSLAGVGVWDVPKGNTVFVKDDTVFWQAAGSPRSGDNNSGAAFNSAGVPMGQAMANAATNATTVRVRLQDVSYLRPNVTAITAAGANQATATAVAEGVSLVSGSTNNSAEGVILPACRPGLTCTVINFQSALTLKVYPPTGKQVNAAGANNAVTQAANTRKDYVCEGTNAYYG